MEPVQFELQKSNSDEIFANMSVQSDLNKIKIETEVDASEIQYMRNLMKMYDEQNTMFMNLVRALKEEFEKFSSGNVKTLNDNVVEQIALMCSNLMEQLNNKIEEARNDTRNLQEALGKIKEETQTLAQSTSSIKNQSISEILHLRTELKKEQQKNVILENRVANLEIQIAEILLRRDFNLKSNKERCNETTNTALISKNNSPVGSTFARNTCELSTLVSQNNKKLPQLLDMEYKKFESYLKEMLMVIKRNKTKILIQQQKVNTI